MQLSRPNPEASALGRGELRRFGLACGWAMVVVVALMEGRAASVSTAELKRMSLEELLQQEVILVSRTPEPLANTASAIQVIPRDEIRRSGATRLAQALRLASNLQVAQVDASRWAVSTRGFNSVLANKLLVMIDGRTVYSPLFAGVFWDTQDIMLEDVERIEVVSGPGGALWGANAVNGVINVRTLSARYTQGLLITGGGGTGLRSLASVRYGGALAPNLHYRVYGKFANRDGNIPLTPADANNDWRRSQGGFRVDWDAADRDLVTVHGDLYENRLPGAAGDSISRGGDLVGRWSRTLSADSDVHLQLYYDRVHRNLPGSYNDRLDTYDVDFQHRFLAGTRHNLVWGANYRSMKDDFLAGRIILLPPTLSLERIGAFVQDHVALMPERLHLTLGTKVEHNDYTGTELQPSARLSWRQSSRQAYWGAVSRAVRTPSRLDRDRFFPGSSAGSPNFESEVMVAWELGARLQPHERLSLAVAAFYHDYDGIRSNELAGPGAPLPRELRNGQKGESYGVEFTADSHLTDWWRVHVGITELRVAVEPKPGSADISFGALESVDSKHYLSLRSTWDLGEKWEIWTHLRHASRLTNRFSNTPGYTELDARIAWRPAPAWEFSLNGRSLLHDQHAEYGDPTLHLKVERSVFGMVRWSY